MEENHTNEVINVTSVVHTGCISEVLKIKPLHDGYTNLVTARGLWFDHSKLGLHMSALLQSAMIVPGLRTEIDRDTTRLRVTLS